MDFSKAFVASLCAGGLEAYKKMVMRGIQADYLEGEGKYALKYVIEHAAEFGEIPSKDIILGKTNIDIGTADGTFDFYIEECLDLNLFKMLKTGFQPIPNLLSDFKPKETLAKLRELLNSIDETHITHKPSQSIFAHVPEVLKIYEDMKAGKRGIPFPFPTMTEYTMGMWPQDLILFVARLGQGKCVHEDTLIVDPVTGVPNKISKVYSDSKISRVTTWGTQNSIHGAEITAKVDTGRKDCLEFNINTGRSIIVTPEHPFMTPDGWKRADEVKVGHSIAIPNVMPEPEAPTVIPEAHVDLLALLLSEGCYTQNQVSFSTGDPKILEIANRASAYMNTEVNYRSNYDYDICKISGKTNPVRQMLYSYGLDHEKAKVKKLPDAIFKLNNKQLARFLSIFWMCDGYTYSAVEIVLASKEMVSQIQSLLLRFGIQSRLKYKKASIKSLNKTYDSWRLRIFSQDLSKFKDSFELWDDKLDNLNKLECLTRNPNVGMARISDRLTTKIKEQYNTLSALELTQLKLDIGWKNNILLRDIVQKGVLRLNMFRKIQKLTGIFSDPCFEHLLDPNLFWDYVTSIEEKKDQKIYDLTVAPTSCFIANDILVHNTWAMLLTARAAWLAGYRVLMCTTEMSQVRIAQRFFAMDCQVPYTDFRRGELPPQVEKSMYDTLKEMMSADDGRFHVIGGDFDFGFDSLRSEVNDFLPDLLIVDGAYLIKSEGDSRGDKAASTFNMLKKLANKVGIPVVVSSQFNREVKKNSPNTAQAENIGLTDVAGWNADIAIALVQTEDMYQDRRMIFKFLKFREGKGDDIEVEWDIENMEFKELASLAPVTTDPFQSQGSYTPGAPNTETMF